MLDVIKLLSAMEAWGYSLKEQFPKYIVDDVDKAVEILSAEVLRTTEAIGRDKSVYIEVGT